MTVHVSLHITARPERPSVIKAAAVIIISIGYMSYTQGLSQRSLSELVRTILASEQGSKNRDRQIDRQGNSTQKRDIAHDRGRYSSSTLAVPHTLRASLPYSSTNSSRRDTPTPQHLS